MAKEWLAPHELMGVAGLPKSRQGLNKRARDEGWEKRKRKGVQGRAIEYAIASLPLEVRQRLIMQEAPSAAYGGNLATSLLTSWIQIFHLMSAQEQAALVDFVLREGTVAMLSRLNIENDAR